jgi:hypothetical protein
LASFGNTISTISEVDAFTALPGKEFADSTAPEPFATDFFILGMCSRHSLLLIQIVDNVRAWFATSSSL